LQLPGTDAPAKLFLLARSYPDNKLPLRVSVNGTELPGLPPNSSNIYIWHEVPVPPTLLVSGANEFEIWADATAMNAWSVALENGHKEPGSFVSTDAGETWRDEKMGFLNVSRGEYVVRVRLSEGTDAPPPSMVWEDADNPRLHRLRQMLPDSILQPRQTLERVRALMTWVCTRWEYRNTSNSVVYAPWDAETIIAWGQAARGHDGREPVVMCVHYAVALVSYCLALGIPARCAISTESINGFKGHFTAEVWFEELGKWVMVDPNMDAILFEGDNPLSIKEIQRAGSDVTDLIRWGPGHEFQVKNPLIAGWIPDTYLNGICFRHRSVWPRTDFLSRQELGPAGHGSTSYCETDLVWETGDLHEGFGMFPYFGDQDYFDAPPHGFPG
jgi:transglutaminase-like putative cysteine protease